MKNGCAKSTSMKGFQLIKLLPLLGATQSAFMKNSETSEYRREAERKLYKQTHGGHLGKLQEQDGSILTRLNASCATRQPGALVLLETRTRCSESEVNKRPTGRAEQHLNGSCCTRLQNGKRLSNTSMREIDTHVGGAGLGITDQTSYMPTTSNHGQSTMIYEPIRTT